MKKEELKIGDQVRLRSGGPLMTVGSFSTDCVSCQWFERKELRSGVFSPESLKMDNAVIKSATCPEKVIHVEYHPRG